VPDERPWSVSAGKPIDEAHGDRPQGGSARHAAEALFKPKAPAASVPPSSPSSPSSPPTGAAPSEQPPPRKPRILTSAKAEVEPRPAPEPPVAAPEQERTTSERASIPPSEYGRIRTLVTYGMTPDQAAALYGASLSEIRRIIGDKEARGKA
jgi:hypothetical protein